MKYLTWYQFESLEIVAVTLKFLAAFLKSEIDIFLWEIKYTFQLHTCKTSSSPCFWDKGITSQFGAWDSPRCNVESILEPQM